MKKALLVLLAAALAALGPAAPAAAFNQPPLNLGLTDILDGAVPGPGTYFTEYLQAYTANQLKDKDGDQLPGGGRVSNLLAMNQLVHVYPHKVGSANLGVDVLLPIVVISGDGTAGVPGPPVDGNPNYLGDLTVGPFLQWFDTKLLGRPFLQRVELDVSMPTGKYDRDYLLNPGSNLWVIEPYYAFTWFVTPEFSTSWRLHYTYSTENGDAFGNRDVQPGQAFHANYSFEYAFRKNFRAALAGYYLKQVTDDEVDGDDVGDSKEQVFAAGPAAHWIVDDHFSLGLKTAWEMAAENRPQGNRTTLRFTYKF